MARRLTAGVVVRHPGSGVPVFLAPESDLPDWASGLVGAHALDGDLPDPPPQHGAGSSKTAWADYASAAGVDVGAHASRDDIIAACQAAHVPTD